MKKAETVKQDQMEGLSLHGKPSGVVLIAVPLYSMYSLFLLRPEIVQKMTSDVSTRSLSNRTYINTVGCLLYLAVDLVWTEASWGLTMHYYRLILQMSDQLSDQS